MLKSISKNFNQNLYKFNIKDKTILLYLILSILLIFQNIVFFFDKDYKYNIFTILSFVIIFLYFNSVKLALLTATLIVNIYYILYQNIYESFLLDKAADDTACATFTRVINKNYNDPADKKYYEYCELSQLKKELKSKDNLVVADGGGGEYPNRVFEGTPSVRLDKNNIQYRHDLSFRQWMIYNYELTPKEDDTFLRYGTFALDDRDIKYGDTNIISLTDAYVKNLQQRGILNCDEFQDASTGIDKDTLVKKWVGYDTSNNTGSDDVADDGTSL